MKNHIRLRSISKKAMQTYYVESKWNIYIFLICNNVALLTPKENVYYICSIRLLPVWNNPCLLESILKILVILFWKKTKKVSLVWRYTFILTAIWWKCLPLRCVYEHSVIQWWCWPVETFYFPNNIILYAKNFSYVVTNVLLYFMTLKYVSRGYTWKVWVNYY